MEFTYLSLQVPMDFYRQLNNITDISEFIDKFIDPQSLDPKWGIHGKFFNSINKNSFLLSFVLIMLIIVCLV